MSSIFYILRLRYLQNNWKQISYTYGDISLKLKKNQEWNTFLILSHFTLLRFADIEGFCLFVFVFLYKLTICGSPTWSKSIGTNFSNSIYSLFVSHFGNSHNISSFIIIIFVMLIYDQWSYYCNCSGAPWAAPSKMMNLVNAACVLTAPPTGQSHLSLSSGLPGLH